MGKNQNSMKNETLYEKGWSDWKPFPDPEKKGYLCAPLGYGVYQLRNARTGKLILFGRSRHVAYRISSLHLSGPGTRNNEEKKKYVTERLPYIEYRTIAFNSEKEARSFETFVKKQEDYIFPERAK